MICLSAVDGDFTWLLCVACPVVWIASTGLRSGIIWNTMMIVSMGVARSVAELKRGELAQQWLFIGLNVVLPLAFSIMIGAIVHAGVQWGIERTELLQELDETSSDLAESYRQLLGSSMPTMSGESPLSPRETEVLTLVAQGLTNRQIAEILFISSATVKTHMEHILDKMGATTRTQAVLCAHQEGLLASSEETLGT
jgi:ATP/maltotriose-dependent transcriptional regulator MalT